MSETNEPWQNWLYLAGRGAGKTRSGAEWVREKVKSGAKLGALIAPTNSDIRKVMIEGSSGILSCGYEGDIDINGEAMGAPTYHPSLGNLLTWKNGARVNAFSAEEPDRLRGPQHEFLWADELAAWKNPQDAWDMAMFGLRLGLHPQVMVSTTPRPIPILRELMRSPYTHTTKSSTFANRANLAKAFFDRTVAKYMGTRIGRQELMAELLEEMEGALWNRETIDRASLGLRSVPAFKRIVVAIDPAITENPTSNLTGIVAAGLGADDRGYVLADRSGRYSPDAWARIAVAMYDELKADRIVAEGNQGGDMVRHTIATVRPNAPITIVHASRSKQARAEPVAALYEQGRITHIEAFPELEDQMCVAPDTLVTTLRGEVAIDKIQKNDLILTRQGYAPVKWVGKTSIKPTLTLKIKRGSQVKLSYTHPVLIEGRGFINAGDLKAGDRVCQFRSRANMSNLKVLNISSKPVASTRDITALVVKGIVNSFMSQSGYRSEGRYQRATIFTTRLKIQLQRIFETLAVYPQAITLSFTNLMALLEPSLIPQNLEVSYEAKNGRGISQEFAFVKSVARNIKFGVPTPIIAQDVAVEWLTVEEIKRSETIPLWDLSINGPHEFFANGILVHNCTWEPLTGDPSPDRLDAMVWALTNLMLGSQSAPIVIPFVTGSPRVIPGQ